MGESGHLSGGWEIAIADNHRLWFARTALACGGTVGRVAAHDWAFSPCGDTELQVFLTPDEDLDGSVDELIATARQLGAQAMGVWVGTASEIRRYGPTLLGRGLAMGWRPRWMVVAADRVHEAPDVAGTAIVTSVDAPLPSELPYAADLPAERAVELASQAGDAVRFFYAVEDSRVVGQIAVHVTDSRQPTACIYSCGVVPAARNRGVGKLLTHSAVTHARRLGHDRVFLNATSLGAPLYLAMGFEDLGEGQTWWMHDLERTVADRVRAVTEAIARDDTPALAAILEAADALLSQPLPCGLTPFRLAAEVGAADTAVWLADHGARVDVAAAWRLGWRRRLAAIVEAMPEVLDARCGSLGATALHEAAQADDAELAGFLLGAGAATRVVDDTYRMTPAEWARYFGHADLAVMLGQPAARADGEPS